MRRLRIALATTALVATALLAGGLAVAQESVSSSSKADSPNSRGLGPGHSAQAPHTGGTGDAASTGKSSPGDSRDTAPKDALSGSALGRTPDAVTKGGKQGP
ncbi:hypothetical protein [Methylobacterium sp. JK268]